MALLDSVILRDTRALQPVATGVGAGTLFCVTDEATIIERSNGTIWQAYSPTAITGNAATATKLLTARTINTVSFDGTANIVVTAAAGTLTGATLNATVLASSLTSVGTLATLTVTATIVGSVNGNAATATALATGRAINGVTFDGTAAITVTAAAGTLSGATLAAGVTASSLTSVGTLATLTVTASIVGSVTGSAATLTTPRAINGVNFDGSAGITVTAAAGTLTGATLAAGVTASSLTSLGTITALAATLATVTKNAVGSTVTVGLTVTNTTAAALGVQQFSPVFQLIGQGWGTTGSASVPVDIIHRLEPVQGATATYNYSVYGEVNNAGYGLLFRASSFGNFTINPAQSYGWETRSTMTSPADGQINLATLATTVGVGLNVLTDGLLKVRTRAQTGYAAIASGASGIATTSTDGHILENDTASLVGTTVQIAPRLRFRSHVWNTTATAADNTDDFFIESAPVSGATPSGLLKVGSSLNGAGATYPLTLTSAGNLVILGSATLGSALTPGNGGTGIASYAVGDLLYASGSTTLSKLAAVGAGRILVSGGVTTAPAWSAFKVGGTLYWENTNTANAADTNYIFTTTYSLPAGTMATDGDELFIEMWVTFSAAVSTKAYQINVGFSGTTTAGFTGGVNMLSNSTAAASAAVRCNTAVRRLSATTVSFLGSAEWAAAAIVQGTTYGTGALTWANALSVAGGGKDGSSNAAALTINQFKITYRPAA